MQRLACFKTYDIRGRVGKDLNEDIAFRIGRGFARVMTPGSVVLGRDIRDSSPQLQAAVAQGLRTEGVDVLDIGLCGTEEVYFATDHLGAGGGVMITASHNPKGDNGAKMVGPHARPMTQETGLAAIHDLACANEFGPPAPRFGRLSQVAPQPAYIEKVLSFIDPAAIGPLRVVVNSGNGAAGPTFDALAAALRSRGARAEFIRVNHTPDPAFPNGIPNPLLPGNRPATADQVRAQDADLGVAWDGDFDRCFFFDETGAFIDGEYIVGLLAAAILARHPGEKIVHDPRVIWNTQARVRAGGGTPVASPTGHAFMKQKLREVDAIYGGEMSAHHYFRDFMYCDSGMIPWLLVLEHVSRSGAPLSALVADMRARHPSSGEINFVLGDPGAALAAVEAQYGPGATGVDRLDGLSLSFADWRFNLRSSNTEPVLRLNVETLGDLEALHGHVAQLSHTIERAGHAE